MTIQHKILSGYFILVAVIGSMAAILLHERRLTKDIEAESFEIRHARSIIHMVHRRITDLATQGESVIVWEESDYRAYHENRLRTDSLLQVMKAGHAPFVHSVHIDTLRALLKDKETHLLRIMQAIHRKEEADSLLANRLPAIVQQAGRTRAVSRRKKGIAGWLGRMETVWIPVSQEEAQTGNDQLIAIQKEHDRRIDSYADSLRIQNRELNRRLGTLITFLDGQAQSAFGQREVKIHAAQEQSYRLFVLVTVSASVLSILSFLIIRHDIIREKKIKTCLQKTNQENEVLLEMRKQIILTVSHDIRGPLGNINNCVELAWDTRIRKKREEYLENIRHSCHHILHLVNNLMDVYRMNEVRDTRNDVPFRLDKLMNNISQEYARKAGYKAILFEQKHRGCCVTVKGDADKLEQTLDNLLTNAVKFTRSGTIGFFTEYVDGWLRVSITDTGIGMDEETLGRVFRPFERAAQEVNSEGFGLGLFITKSLVEVLDGRLDVESCPGKGTMFSLAFPLPETEETYEAEELYPLYPTVLPKRVLVVDDDNIQLKIAEDMLGRNGVACMTCRNVREAIAALYRSDYELVLTDIQMPETDGFGLLKLLRSSDIDHLRTIPVAVMTARGDGDSGVYAKAGFCGCLHKPFTMKGLLAFLSSVTTGYTADSLRFDYTRLLESADTDGRRHMFRLVVQESEKDLVELENALKDTNREAMRRTIHRMMPVWELLGAGNMLSAYRKTLHDRAVSERMVREHTLKVMEYIRNLINEAKHELERKDNRKEADSTYSGRQSDTQ